MTASPRVRRVALLTLVLLLAVIVGGAAGWWFAGRNADRADREKAAKVLAEEGEAAAQNEADTANDGARAAKGFLRARCQAGDRSACKLRDEIDRVIGELDAAQPAEDQEGEIQEPEIQEPEEQDSERQDAETDDPDANDPEAQDEEQQDEEEQEAEIDDPDPDDPEVQDPEIDDPEFDDPDPNSALTFSVSDSCNPGAGEYVTDIGLDVTRGSGTITYTLTCSTAAFPTLPTVPGTDG